MKLFDVAWKIQDGRHGDEKSIFTIGKWGSENTPQLVAAGMAREVAAYIVHLHNKSLQPSR